MTSSSPLTPRPHDAVPGHDAKSGVGALQHGAGMHPGERHLIERGYVPVRQLTGKVVGVWGDAHIRLHDGQVRPLHVGDVVRKGDVVLTSQDGIVQIEGAHAKTMLAAGGDDVERIISQVGNGDADVVPAAGPNAGGAGGSLGEGLRVGRDSESVTAAGLGVASPATAPIATAQGQAVSPLVSAPVANPDSESTASNTPVTFDPRHNDSSTSAVTIVAVAGHPISPNGSVTLPQGTVTMNPDGTLTFTPGAGTSGSITFTYTESNGSAGTSTSTITVDVAPPPAPPASIGLQHDGASDTGVSATDSLTANPHPVLAGTGAPSSTITITVTPTGGSAVTYTARTDANGQWSLDTATATPASGALPAGGLPDGNVALSVATTDAAGTSSSATGSFTEDRTPPAAAIGLSHDGANDTGASSTDGVTSNPRPVLAGSGEPNASVTITLTTAGGATLTYTATTDASGHWTLDTATASPTSGTMPAAGLPGGSVGLQVTSTDAAGNTTTATGSFTEDTTPPATSVGLQHDAASDTGASATDGVTSNAKPVLAGTGEPNGIVTVTVTPAGGAPIAYTVTTDASGHWTLDTAAATPSSGAMPAAGLPEGPVALQATSTDAAGNTTTATGSFTEDLTPPAAAIGLRHDAADDTGASATDSVTSNGKPVLEGTGEPDGTVTITVTPNGGSPIAYTATTDANGRWTLDTATATPTAGTMPATGLGDGGVALQVTSTDAAGHTTTATGSFTEDSTPPTATVGLQHDAADDTGASSTDGVTGNAKPVLAGTAEPNGAVTVTVTPAGGAPITYTATADASGHWSVDTATATPASGAMPAAGLPDGPVALQATSTDAAGNTSTAAGSFTEDRTPPAATIGLQHDAASDTGVSPTDSVTTNTKPVLAGTGEANSTVSITLTPSSGAPVSYTATTDASGHWTLDTATATPTSGALPAAGLPNGAVALSVSSTDAAGNTATATGSFTEDLAPPSVAIGLKHDAADDTGSSSTDSLTTNTRPVLTGTGEAGSTVTITVTPSSGGAISYTATTDASGTWSLDTATAVPTSGTMPAAGLPEGLVGLSVTSTDAAGNISTATGSFTEDLTTPVASIGLKHDAADDTGASATDSLTNNARPILTGTGEADSTVSITVTPSSGAPITYTAATDASGAWSLDTATATPTSGTLPAAGLPDGNVGLSVSSTDAAGNTTTATGSFTEDLAAPGVSIGLKHDAADDTGSSATDDLTSNTRPVLTGTGDANSSVTITVTPSSGGSITYTATTDASGAWSLDTATATPTSGTMPAAGLPQGAVGLTVSATDAAGNTATATGSFDEDLTPPAASIGLQHDAADDTGASSTDDLTNNARPVLTGTGEANGTVSITVTPSSGGALSYTATTDAAGHWSLDTATATPTAGTMPAAGLPDGPVALQVVSTDAAGNTTTATGAFTEDLGAPAASIGLKHDAADDTGASSTDNLTNNAKPVLTGTGEANGTVTISVTPSSGGAISYTTTTDASGHWSLDTATAVPTSGTMPAAGLPEGLVGLSVTSTDAAGNITTATGSFTEDLTTPAVSIGLKHDAADDTGASAIDGLTHNAKPILTGTGEANGTVHITVTPSSGGAISYTATTDASGAWSLDTATAVPTSGTLPAAGLPDGLVNLSVMSTDAAGNATTATGSFTEDLGAPAASIGLQHDAADDTGVSSVDSLTNNARPVLTGTGEANGTVHITVTPSSGGAITYTATTDGSGHWSLDTATAAPTSGTMPTGSFTEDFSTPAVSIGLKHDAADDTGASSTDNLTNNVKPVLTGTGEANGTVTITVTPSSGGSITYTATTDTSGAWSLDTATATPTSGTMPAAGLPQGAVGLQVSSTDAAGNTSIGLQHDAANDTGASSTDDLTNNARPVLTGTGEANGTVSITVTPSSGGALTYTATTDAAGHWSLDTATATPTAGTMPAAGLPDGPVALQVVSTDAAGNTTTATGAFTEDLGAPAASIGLQHDAANDTGRSSTDGVTANAKPVLAGTGEADSMVTITVTPSTGGAITYTAATDATGHWSLDTGTAAPSSGTMPAAGLPDGTVGLQVVSTDAAGNTTTATGAFAEDHTPPAATIGLRHDAADDTGTSATDNLTHNGKPVLTGTGEPSSTVAITVTPSSGGAITYSATTDASGHWSLDTATATPATGTMPAGGLPDGSVTLQVVSIDAAGNTSAGTSAFGEDRTPPTAAIDLQHDGVNDTGSSPTDGVTANTQPVIAGTGEASSQVTVSVTAPGGVALTYVATTDASGAWSIDLAAATPATGTMPAAGLPDGAIGLQVSSTDAAGNTATATGSFTVNHSVPAATIDLVHDAADDTGASMTDGITRNTSPVIAGTGQASSVVQVTVTDSAGHTLTWDAATDAGGHWSLDTATATPTSGALPAGGFADGAVALKVVTTDAAGNSATATGAFTVDHTAPAAAIDLRHDAANDTGTSATDGLTSNTRPVLTGTGEANSSVTITVTPSSGGALAYTAATDASGHWSLDTGGVAPTSGTMPAAGLPDGSVGLQVVTTDVAGNTATATGSFDIDHTAPVASIDLRHDALNDTGSSATDGLTSNAKPILVGTGEANSTVAITVTPASGSPVTYTATTDGSGNWSVDTSSATPASGALPVGGLVDGTVGLKIVSIDTAGNSSTATGSFVEDHTAPTAAIGLKHDATDDTGASASDNLTSYAKPTLVGTGEANSTVTITITPAAGGAITYTATTDASGAWSLDTATATPTSGTMPAGGLADGSVNLDVVST
ncbi:MAG: cadherin-like domain-containing protein, partial [Burkholderiales bacterium]|nr:cadherin-like domain-containing protein [Burkholderiales bacterium]